MMPRKKSSDNMFDKINYILTKKQKFHLILLFIVILIGTALELLGVSAILPLIDVVMNPDVIESNQYLYFIKKMFDIDSIKGFILFVSLSLVVIYIVKNLYLVFMNSTMLRFTKNCQVFLSTRIMDVYVKQDYLFHVTHNTAELQRNISYDVSQFIQFVNSSLQLLTEMSVCVVLVIFLIMQDVFTTLAVAGILSIFIIGTATVLKNVLGELGEKGRIVGAMGTQISLQIFQGIKDIKVFNREEFFINTYSENAIENAGLQRKQQLYNYLPKPIMESICICGLLATLSIKIYFGEVNEIERFIPVLSVFAIAAFRMLPSFNRITGYMGSIMYAKPSVSALYDDLIHVELLEKNTGQEIIEGDLKFRNEITIKDVYFSYPNKEKNVLEGVSFSISKNSSVAIIGPSGAGKTTLVDILLGILKPQKGLITVDDKDIFSNIGNWHSMVGYIPQEIYLIDDSIRRNIAFGMEEEDIDNQAIERAIREAQLDGFIKELPAGIESRVGERGVMLSGGQRQRIGIARALYHNPSVLVLDEATSALDNATEAAVMEAINSFQGNKTLIVIAHRLTTIRNCDCIYEVRDGRISPKNKEELFTNG